MITRLGCHIVPLGGYTRDDWSQRKQIEADFCELGFSSKKFSHKNENVNRQADSLLLSWVPWGKSNPTERLAIETIEIRVTFYPNVTVYDISRTERIGACMPKKMGKTQFREFYSKESDALDYAKYLLQKPYVRF